jgi:hypothetical protein
MLKIRVKNVFMFVWKENLLQKRVWRAFFTSLSTTALAYSFWCSVTAWLLTLVVWLTVPCDTRSAKWGCLIRFPKQTNKRTQQRLCAQDLVTAHLIQQSVFQSNSLKLSSVQLERLSESSVEIDELWSLSTINNGERTGEAEEFDASEDFRWVITVNSGFTYSNKPKCKSFDVCLFVCDFVVAVTVVDSLRFFQQNNVD